MWPYGRSRGMAGETARKTIQNNASALRSWIGVEHLPDARWPGATSSRASPRTGPPSSASSERPTPSGGEAARALRTEALEPRPRRALRGPQRRRLRLDRRRGPRRHHDRGHRHRAPTPRHRPARGRRLRRRRRRRPRRSARRAGRVRRSGSSALGPSGPGGTDEPLERWLADAGRHLDAADVERIRRLARSRRASRVVAPGEGAQRRLGPPALLLARRRRGGRGSVATSRSGAPSIRVRAISTTSRGVSTPAATAAARSPGQRSSGSCPVSATSRASGSGTSSRRQRRRSPADPADLVPDGVAAFPAARRRASRHHLPGGGQRVGLGLERRRSDRCATSRSRTTSRSDRSMDNKARAAKGSVGASVARRSSISAAGAPSASRRASSSPRSGALGPLERGDASGQASRLGGAGEHAHVLGEGAERSPVAR